MKTEKLTILGLLSAIAAAIFILESLLPPLLPIPGIKLGLANIVTLFILLRYQVKDAVMVLTVRVIIAAIFSGQIVYLLYSAAGGAVSLFIMAAANKLLNRKFIFITGILGAIGHNMGQIFVALVVLKMSGILVYVPFLIISGVATGLFTGLICCFTDRHIPGKNNVSKAANKKNKN